MNLVPASLPELSNDRQNYVGAMRCQIVHESLWDRGFIRGYRIGRQSWVGVLHLPGEPRVVREFYERDADDLDLETIVHELKDLGVVGVQYQTNDHHIRPLLQFCSTPGLDMHLFGNWKDRGLNMKDFFFGTLPPDAEVFPHEVEPVGKWSLVNANGEVCATADWLSHYNPPFVDLFMEVREEDRGQGIGAFIVQETAKEAISLDLEPCARCRPTNTASQRALLKAGSSDVGDLSTALFL